ncbi:MAG: HAD family hydrolase [Pseudomonadales bacterium]
MADVKIITFDLDNTLWDVDSVIRAAEARMRSFLAEVVPEYAAHWPADALLELRGAIVRDNPAWRHNLSKLREEVLYRAIRACGYGEREARRHAADAFAVFFEARHEVVYFEGAEQVLEALARDFLLGALTNGNARIDKLGLDRFFAFGYSAADVGAGKPAPDMFHAALRHGSAQAHECIHVGDHLVDDIQGAGDVGMHTIWVNLREQLLPEGAAAPTDSVTRVPHIPEAVARIAGRAR